MAVAGLVQCVLTSVTLVASQLWSTDGFGSPCGQDGDGGNVS